MSDARPPATSDPSEHLLARLEALAARVEEQVATIEELQARNAAQQAEISDLKRGRPVAQAKPRRGVSRARFFRAAGLATAGLAAGLMSRPRTSEASTGQPLLLGTDNSASIFNDTSIVNSSRTFLENSVFEAANIGTFDPFPPVNTVRALTGVYDAIGATNSTTPGIGVYGQAVPAQNTSGGSAGVRGDGTGNAVGVLGTADNSVAVYGISTNSVGMAALSSNSYGLIASSSSFAGIFYGHHYVTGNQYVAGGKYAAVKAPDGSHRLLHAVEAPEAWFEDIGSGQLANGRATVRLDPDFAGVVATEEYQVFLTPEGDCNGLYVASKSASGFEVRELKAGASSLTFGYRIIARRKDLVGRPRLEKVTLPEAPRLPEFPPSGPPEPGRTPGR